MIYTPNTAEEAAKIIASEKSLHLTGNGTRSVETHETSLSSKEMSGVIFYEPKEMVVRVKAGTPVSVLASALAEHKQRLGFEPFSHGFNEGEETCGGMVATNASGSRRIQVGACRDNLIGVQFVNGRGEVVKAGGRVMKDVTGLDFSKLMAGSRGRLAFLTEVTFKVQPMPEITKTLAIKGLSVKKGIEALSKALGSPYDVTGSSFRGDTAYIRIEGLGFSVDYRIKALQDWLKKFGSLVENNGEIWKELRTASRFKQSSKLWRVSTPPSEMVALANADYDWGGGLAFTNQNEMPVVTNGFVENLKGLEKSTLPKGIATIENKLKNAFDPEGKFI